MGPSRRQGGCEGRGVANIKNDYRVIYGYIGLYMVIYGCIGLYM